MKKTIYLESDPNSDFEDEVMVSMADQLTGIIITPKIFDDIVRHLKWFYFCHMGEDAQYPGEGFETIEERKAAIKVANEYLEQSGERFYSDGSNFKLEEEEA